jgi:hypothetical protein
LKIHKKKEEGERETGGEGYRGRRGEWEILDFRYGDGEIEKWRD